MRWAICPTLSVKVDADNVAQVSQCRGNFFCPICHERVTYRHEGSDSRSASFVHPKAKDKFVPCPLRTFGFSITPNENTIRAPFPLILTNDGDYYHLNVRFRPVPPEYHNLSTIWISIDSIHLKFQLNDIISGNAVKRISKPPSANTRILSVDASKENYMLLNSWGSYIDYFRPCGALFEYSTGKKVSIEESVYCDTDYLLILTSEEKTPLKEFLNSIVIEKKGSLHSGNHFYPVYHIKLPEFLSKESIDFSK